MSQIKELENIMARLRAEGGCPWDRKQTHDSLKQYLLEEAGEVLDAIDEGDDENLVEELGDLLLQVVFHSQIVREEGRFDLEAVAKSINEKMIRRHPHVFGDIKLDDSDAVVTQWEKIKKQEKSGKDSEKGPKNTLDSVPRNLTALHRAQKLLKKAEKSDVKSQKLVDSMQAETTFKKLFSGEKVEKNEAGDMLLALAQKLNEAGINGEETLHAANLRFVKDFKNLEQQND